MANELKRNYEGSDAAMLEASETMQAQYLLDVADFTAFDTTLTLNFGNDWAAAIEAALVSDSDDLVVAQQLQTSNQVAEAMKNCTENYSDVMYFADKAFKGNKEVLQEFGRGAKYERARKSQPRMVDFMEELHRTAIKYTSQLTAKGCGAGTIAAIETAGLNLRSKNTAQNLTIGGRPVVSRERVILLNAAYAPMAQVIDAAQRVYRNNAAKMGQYSYTPIIQHGSTESVTLNLGGNAPVQIVALEYDAEREITFRNAGPSTVEVQLSVDSTNPAGPWQTVGANDAALTITSSQLALAGNYIIARLANNPGAQLAQLEVEWEV
jgi:hypothetical protein